jgi:hypothetical protein
MGLTMGERKAVTETIAMRYRRAGMAEKRRILDELCATMGWHRDLTTSARRCASRCALQTWSGRGARGRPSTGRK